MTVSFSTHWKKSMGEQYAGKPNYFTNKIAKCAWENYHKEFTHFVLNETDEQIKKYDELQPFGNMSVEETENLHPKKHTMRQDPHDRWKVGMKIHPVINNRTKNRFQFAPVMECKGIQKIEIKWFKNGLGNFAILLVDGKRIGRTMVDVLALNDGFDSVEQFFAWFNEDFEGKIIHWTDLKY